MQIEKTEMTRAEMAAMIETLKAEQAKLKDLMGKSISCKVSEKGAVSVYGMGRFPVTLYASQWQMLIDNISIISNFIDVNKELLKVKPEKTTAEAVAQFLTTPVKGAAGGRTIPKSVTNALGMHA